MLTSGVGCCSRQSVLNMISPPTTMSTLALVTTQRNHQTQFAYRCTNALNKTKTQNTIDGAVNAGTETAVTTTTCRNRFRRFIVRGTWQHPFPLLAHLPPTMMLADRETCCRISEPCGLPACSQESCGMSILLILQL